MEKSLHARLEPVAIVADALSEVAAASARKLGRRLHAATRKHVGETLRPGADTPLWNTLVSEVRPLLARRGEQALLPGCWACRASACTTSWWAGAGCRTRNGRCCCSNGWPRGGRECARDEFVTH